MIPGKQKAIQRHGADKLSNAELDAVQEHVGQITRLREMVVQVVARLGINSVNRRPACRKKATPTQNRTLHSSFFTGASTDRT